MKWLNKLITHDRDGVGDFGSRVVLHIPVGFAMGLLDWNNGLVKLFNFYEKNEDVHTLDEAWKDVFGAMVGWVIGRVALVALIIYAVAKVMSLWN